MIGSLRLYSGLILFAYVLGHLFNHMAGIVSIEAMDALNRVMAWPWRTIPGTVLLVGALIVHVSLALYGVYARRNLTMKRWETAQLILGLSIPLLLALHFMGTRVIDEVADARGDYDFVMLVLWVFKPEIGVQQAVALLIVWAHACIGLHMWLRLKPWYNRVRWLAVSLATAIPVLALAGYVSAGFEVMELAASQQGWAAAVMADAGRDPAMARLAEGLATRMQLGVIAIVILVFAARYVRALVNRRKAHPVIRYSPGDRQLPIVPGGSVLETIRAAGIRHASVCGGRGRCSTCRVRVGLGRAGLTPPSDDERLVLSRLGFDGDDVRLACQLRPSADVAVTALLPHEDPARAGGIGDDYQKGDELEVACLFVDLRGSTRLSEERLPFDVVFVLNQFFAELSAALEETNGHYAQFNGDGLMALYGLDETPAEACRQALAGAAAMARRIDALSERLQDELGEPLKIGIGVHFGEAIVGSMGPPKSPIISALGDNINIAARLEQMTKELGVRFCISARTLEIAGVNITDKKIHALPVKGRERPVRVVGLDNLREIAEGD